MHFIFTVAEITEFLLWFRNWDFLTANFYSEILSWIWEKRERKCVFIFKVWAYMWFREIICKKPWKNKSFWIDLAVYGSGRTGKSLCGNLSGQMFGSNTYLWQVKLVCTPAKITWLLSGSECVKHLIMLLYLSTRCLTWIWEANFKGKWRREFQLIIINELTSLSFLSLQKPLCVNSPDTTHYIILCV